MTGSQMVPLAFGAPGKQLFGAQHLPPQDVPARATGVVLCPPLGWEMIASQRSHRVLAEQLAALGFHVLRFDYAGTGDSPGDETEPDRLNAWLKSIAAAIEELRRRAAVEKVCLIGVRIGATLAAEFASRHPQSVEGLVLWAPFLTGRSFLRELQAYRLLNNEKFVGRAADDEEAAGFVVTRATAAELEAIDLSEGALPPPCPVLLLAREEQLREQSLAERLRAQGSVVELEHLPGLVPMMQEPRKSEVPEAVLQRIGEWLAQTFPRKLQSPSGVTFESAAIIEHDGIRERALFIGDDPRMFGFIVEPLTKSSRTRPVLMWLNTGSDPRVGPNRQYVVMARRLAQRGFTSLRFDPRAVGDCPGEHSPDLLHPYSEGRMQDVRAAMAWLARHTSAQRFVLIGLCSGAYVAFHHARSDPRVVGVVMINPQTYLWKDGDSMDVVFESTRYYQSKLRNPRTWSRLLRGEINVRGIARVLSRRSLHRTITHLKRLLRVGTEKEFDVRGAFLDTLRRGTAMLLVLGDHDGGVACTELHLGPNARALRKHQGFHLETVAGVDHTFSQRWAKEWLSDRVIRHVEICGGEAS